ncbi:MAG: transporter permease [Pseudonocardiales bacterium]|jgi:hypothetical protein|nr:transporter permease [Pseudonocardiales bacterium]
MARRENLARRFWVETALATVSSIMAVVTLISREWIEVVFGVDPDHGNGVLEWALVVGLGLAAATLGLMARVEWRRPHPA